MDNVREAIRHAGDHSVNEQFELELVGEQRRRVYPVILADPPWTYRFSPSKSRSISNQYPTLTLEQIKGITVAGLAAQDSVLWLWATSPLLPEALEVMEAWGFTYATQLVWVKPSIGPGYHVRQQHESVLIGTRGALPVPPFDLRHPSVVLAPRRGHSVKPDRVHEILETYYPGLARLELFARRARLGWDVWGNQVSSNVHLHVPSVRHLQLDLGL